MVYNLTMTNLCKFSAHTILGGDLVRHLYYHALLTSHYTSHKLHYISRMWKVISHIWRLDHTPLGFQCIAHIRRLDHVRPKAICLYNSYHFCIPHIRRLDHAHPKANCLYNSYLFCFRVPIKQSYVEIECLDCLFKVAPSIG